MMVEIPLACLTSFHMVKSIINILKSQTILKDKLALRSKKEQYRFLIIIPIFNELEIVEELVNDLCKIQNENIDIVLTTHISQVKMISKINIMLQLTDSQSNLKLLINDKVDSTKAGQVSYTINTIATDNYDYISIYDCDSFVDTRAMDYINTFSYEHNHVFQQIPFYPNVFGDDFLQDIALTRNIHSLNYTYSCEIITFHKSISRNPFRMSTHLLGHGEHMPKKTIDYGGGFRPPFCDSALGFSLSFLEVPIHIIPYPDISSSPSSIYDSYQQGVRWYAGCDLYWREYRRIQPKDIKVYVKLLYTLMNNIRWSIFPLACIYLFHKGFYEVTTIIVGLLFVRHLLLFSSYQQLSNIAKDHLTLVVTISKWIYLFLPYLLMRLIWSIAPIEYYLRLIFKKPFRRIPTPKDVRKSNVDNE